MNVERIGTAVLLLLLTAYPVRGQGKAVGGFHAYDGCGITFSGGAESRRFQEIRLLADFEGVLQGREPLPGIRASVFSQQALYRWDAPDGTVLTLFAGPGVTGGYVKDRGASWGTLLGLSADAGIRLQFSAPFELRAGFTADLAGHWTVRNRYNNTLTYYHNGLINIFLPYIVIAFRFE